MFTQVILRGTFSKLRSAFSIKEHISVDLKIKECIFTPLHIAGEIPVVMSLLQFELYSQHQFDAHSHGHDYWYDYTKYAPLWYLIKVDFHRNNKISTDTLKRRCTFGKFQYLLLALDQGHIKQMWYRTIKMKSCMCYNMFSLWKLTSKLHKVHGHCFLIKL